MIHQTDLFHPHEDPDDHFDLATVFSIGKRGCWDVQGIVIDYPPEREEGDPAVVAVGQLGRMTERVGVPVVVGSRFALRDRKDNQHDRASRELAAARWICRTLENSPQPMPINISGSCTDVALAALMCPEVFREKCSGIYLNAGAAHPCSSGELEYNVRLNPSSFAAIFDAPCPVYWCPCFDQTGLWEVGRNGTWWAFQQGPLLENISPELCNFFLYMLDRSRDPKYLRYMEGPVDKTLLAKFSSLKRNMWCTAPLLYAAGMGVDVSEGIAPVAKVREPLFRFSPISIQCEDNGEVKWRTSSDETNRFIFHIEQPELYERLMFDSLLELMRSL